MWEERCGGRREVKESDRKGEVGRLESSKDRLRRREDMRERVRGGGRSEGTLLNEQCEPYSW